MGRLTSMRACSNMLPGDVASAVHTASSILHLQPVLAVKISQLPLQPSNPLSSKTRHITNLKH
jgi:hypothetical protein